jgi:NAD(P)-dependent dehydrogenase (short-subunit alcohol dehydrogenase family)
MRLKNKVAIVTGGGSGIGRGICLRFAEEGAKVVVADVNPGGAQTVVQEIGGGDKVALAVAIDVRKQEQVQAMVDATVKAFGGIDVLVNNAGVGKIIPFFETTEDDWDFIFDINCKGLLFCSQAVARQMIE